MLQLPLGNTSIWAGSLIKCPLHMLAVVLASKWWCHLLWHNDIIMSYASIWSCQVECQQLSYVSIWYSTAPVHLLSNAHCKWVQNCCHVMQVLVPCLSLSVKIPANTTCIEHRGLVTGMSMNSFIQYTDTQVPPGPCDFIYVNLPCFRYVPCETLQITWHAYLTQ